MIISERLLNCIDPKRWLGLGAGYRRFEGKGQVEVSTAAAPLAQSGSVFQGCSRVQVANGHLQADKPSGNGEHLSKMQCMKLSSNVDF